VATVVGERIAFVHVPKTGGTWAVNAMRMAGIDLRPLDSDRFHGHVPLLDRERFAIGFVREPLSWYESFWRHRQRFQDFEKANPLDRFSRLEFPRYLERVCEKMPGFLSEQYEQYVGPPEDPIDFIGRYERLADDLVRALNLAGEEFNEAKLRACRPANVAGGEVPPYDVELARALRSSEHAAVSRFYPELL